jgi:hypothetical protein
VPDFLPRDRIIARVLPAGRCSAARLFLTRGPKSSLFAHSQRVQCSDPVGAKHHLAATPPHGEKGNTTFVFTSPITQPKQGASTQDLPPCSLRMDDRSRAKHSRMHASPGQNTAGCIQPGSSRSLETGRDPARKLSSRFQRTETSSFHLQAYKGDGVREVRYSDDLR